MSERLLYFSPAVRGGLADYARAQANALGRLGVEVDVLSTPDFPLRPDDRYVLQAELTAPKPSRSRWSNRLASFRAIMRHHGQLSRVIEANNYRRVLFGSYAEYLAPLWKAPLARLARRGVIFGAVVHDPVRDYIVGPLAWHRSSVACAYSILREAFVHESITLDTVRAMPALRTTVLPVGAFSFPPASATRGETRRRLGIPDAAQVWLSFGHVRDGKNIDLVIRALARFPHAVLLVAGQEQSKGQKPVQYYRELARECGVAQQCIWLDRFIPAEEVGDLFVTSDLILLTYGRTFRSASGVSNAAVHFRKPCIASSGQGNLRSMVSKYDLGIWVEPNELESLVAGIHRWQSVPPVPRWEEYASDNSWRHNAEIVRDRMFES